MTVAASLPDDCEVSSFAPIASPILEICTPTYRDDASGLVEALSRCEGAAGCGLTIYDDGSGDPALTERHRAALEASPAAGRLIVAAGNRGRSEARNRLASAARSDWILLLDADMRPDRPDFIARYINAIETAGGPALIAGGFSLDQAERSRGTRLHAAQSAASECADAKTRACDPGRYVFTSNILVHRSILDAVAFDEGFSGWGWEDVDWGLRVVDSYPVLHIDNPATHLGLETDARLIDKYATSGDNFARLVARHPGPAARMPLYRAALKLRRVPGRSAVAALARVAAQGPLPTRLRLAALKLFRAAIYAERLK